MRLSPILLSALVLSASSLVGCDRASTPGPAAPAASAGAAGAAGGAVTPDQVDISAFVGAVESGAVVIDVRTAGEFAGGHVPGARNVPLSELSQRMAELQPLEQPLYLICQSGGRSARAQALLAQQGIVGINVVGGTGAWIRAGHAVE